MPLRLRAGHEPLSAAFAGRDVLVCGSGTQALAMALLDARSRSSAAVPEVILPAYGCPDLVAASLYAGVFPRLVDTAPGEWGYDAARLREALSANTVALVGVNLLGTGDQATELHAIATAHGVPLIQDSAQHLPQDLSVPWLGDYVVLSFGRGKPLNLLGGGALLYPRERAGALASLQTRPVAGSREWPPVRRLESLAFNIATHPRVYGVARRLLGASLGRTQYKPLAALESVSPGKVIELESALALYRERPGYDAGIWAAACGTWLQGGVAPLTCTSGATPGGLRLRMALLARDRRMRDEIVAVLESRGLGATALYGQSMERLDDVPADVANQGPFPNSADLAERLFTLPTHSAVTPRDVRLTQESVRAVLASSPR